MMGRWLGIGIVIFWAVMTTAHVKRVWFASVDLQAGPSAEELLRRFLSLEESDHNLEVYHRGEWVGVVNFSSEDIGGEGGSTGGKQLEVMGIATLPLATAGGEASERFGLRAVMVIAEQGVVESMKASLKLASTGLRLEADYDRARVGATGGLGQGGGHAPAKGHPDGGLGQGTRYRIYQGDEVLLDSADEDAGLVLAPSLLWLKPLVESGMAGGAVDHGARWALRTRKESQNLAGRRRTVCIIEPELDLSPSPLRIHLTEGGEIVRITIFGELDMRSVLLTMSSQGETGGMPGVRE